MPALATLALLAPSAPHAHAVTILTDVARPRWNVGVYNSSLNALDCSALQTSSPSCFLRLTTTTDVPGCESEALAPSGVVVTDTECSASIAGKVTARTTPVGCLLTAESSLTVSFTSGVSTAMNGKFLVSGTFKPLTTYPVKSYALTISDASPLMAPGSGYGSLVATFRIKTNGIPERCDDADYPGRRGTPTTSNGLQLTVAVG